MTSIIDHYGTIPAGRQLDALVAEYVFGRDPEEAKLSPQWGGPANLSTDIYYAWVVLENIRGRGYAAHVQNMNNGQVWTVQFSRGSINDSFVASGETAPLAICRAAMLVVRSNAR